MLGGDLVLKQVGVGRRAEVLEGVLSCGAGLTLDLGITGPERYVGIDPSQGMIKTLVMKYPHTAGLHPMTVGEALERRLLGGTTFDVVLAMGGAGSHLSNGELNHARSRLRGTAAAHGANVTTVGRFEVLVLRHPS